MNIQVSGRAGILFTDDDGTTYKVGTEMLMSKRYDMVLYSNDIEPIDSDIKLTNKEKEIIVSKIVNFTKGIKWLIE